MALKSPPKTDNQRRNDFEEAVALLRVALDAVEAKLQKYPPSTGSIAAGHLLKLEDMGTALGEQTKRLGALIARYRFTLIPEFFAKEKLKSISVDHNDHSYRVGVSLLFRASVQEGMKDDAIKWLKKNKGGYLVQSTINASSLSSFAKELVEEKGKDLPDNIFKVGTAPSTSVTKTK